MIFTSTSCGVIGKFPNIARDAKETDSEDLEGLRKQLFVEFKRNITYFISVKSRFYNKNE